MSKPPVGEAYVVREDFDDIPRVYKIVVVTRSAKQVRVLMNRASGHRTNFDPDIFDRHYMPTRQAAIALWRRHTQEEIERNTREIASLRKMLTIEPKDARR
jgi:hypothetical protein